MFKIHIYFLCYVLCQTDFLTSIIFVHRLLWIQRQQWLAGLPVCIVYMHLHTDQGMQCIVCCAGIFYSLIKITHWTLNASAITLKVCDVPKNKIKHFVNMQLLVHWVTLVFPSSQSCLNKTLVTVFPSKPSPLMYICCSTVGQAPCEKLQIWRKNYIYGGNRI